MHRLSARPCRRGDRVTIATAVFDALHEWADETLVRSLFPRMVCTKCGMVEADVLALATADQ
jgi:hypothetical protein